MAKAKKLPSGAWRTRVQKNGVSKSFTAATKKESELLALQWLANQNPDSINLTIQEMVENYITSKENILSPTTIESYREKLRNCLADMSHIRVNELTKDLIQNHINELSLKVAPKTVRNAYGLLRSALNTYAPEKCFPVTLPKVQKNIKHIPTAEEVIPVIVGSEIELPCMLAIWLGMRMSEVRGAKKSDIQNGVLTIKETIVTAKRKHIAKQQTKTFDSTRIMRIPDHIQRLIEALPAEQDKLTLLSGQAIYKRFVRLLEKNGVPHMTFHDLRHLNASVMLMLNVPDKYAMERGGWSSNNVMKSVYQHTFSSEREVIDNKIDDYFNKLIDENTRRHNETEEK